ncbi:membrane-spanning 4-domains subfamily A member 8-like isoform 3-T3 [Vipera latastei]
MATGSIVFIPSNGANVIQMAPGLPGVVLQASGATPYPQCGAQQLGISTSAPQQAPQKGPMERFLNAQTKVLGFISSGSLCVAAANRPNHALVKTSVGLNITSALMALTGIILYLCELIFTSISFRYRYLYDNEDLNQITTIRNVGYGFSTLLLFFSLLEFCIAVSLAHFGCQATCCSDAQPTMVFVPYQVIGDGASTPEPNPPPPPTYDSVATKSQ